MILLFIGLFILCIAAAGLILYTMASSMYKDYKKVKKELEKDDSKNKT
jgi:membrane protein CcdC involved in cytochrome C biogenesis